MYNFRTDLADERIAFVKSESKKKDIDGIITQEKKYHNSTVVYTVDVINDHGSRKIDKKIGKYITIDIDSMEYLNKQQLISISKIFSNNLNLLLKNYRSLLFVGLGNEDTTADSLGSKIIKELEITRHLLKYNPSLLPNGIREISAIAPGVLGTTGIETQEIIKGVIDKIKFDAIVVIDALTSNNTSRLLRTIQLCNTGIVPGSGVKNNRSEISFETMGIPVIAIGVPTVVNTATLVADTLDILIQKFDEFGFLKDSSHQEKQQLIEKILEPSNNNLAVMPKDIDFLVENMKEIMSSGINRIIRKQIN